jgi:hypothetical protein
MTTALRPTCIRLIAGAAALFTVALGLTGCQMGGIQLSGPAPVTTQAAGGVTLSGIVHGGQYPIYGTTLQLYAAGAPAAPTTGSATGGLGQGATALITPGSMTLASTNNYYPGGASGCTYLGTPTLNPLGCTALPQTTTGGSFSITGDYSCPSSTSKVYLVATGGDPTGANSSSINNQYIAMMAALGPCGNLSSSTGVVLNEVTTVGAVYALNQFMAAPSGAAASTYSSQGGATSGVAVNIGASSGPVGGYGASAVQTQQIGLTNAFKMVNNISDYTQGTANAIAANTWATPYSAMTYTVADILAACVNINPAVSGTNCTNLMSYAKVGGVTPADTIQAAWMMARYPQGVNVSSLYGLIVGTSAPFPSYLTTAPSQYTIEVGYQPATTGSNSLLASTGCSSTNGTNGTNCAISNPISGAFDEYGDLWAYNLNPQSTAGTNTAPQTKVFVTEIAPNGALLNGPFNSYTAHGGYQVSSADPCATTYTHYLSYWTASSEPGIAIDQNNVVWVSNSMEVTNSGGIASGDCSTASAYSLMRITGSNASGGASLATGYYTEYSVGPLAVDSGDNVWAAPSNGQLSSTGYPIVTLTNAGTFASGAFNTFNAQAIAIDTSGGATGSGLTSATTGNVWVDSANVPTCNSYAAGVVYQSPTSSISSPTLAGGYYGANVACTASSLISPTQQVNAAAGMGNPYGIAIDKNNGVWVANYATPSTDPNYKSPVVSYLLPTSSSWIAGTTGTQASPDTATPEPSSVALDSNNSGLGNTNSNGFGNPGTVAVDGSNIAWASNLQGDGNGGAVFQVALSGSGSGATISTVSTPAIVGGGGSGLKIPSGANPLLPNSGGVNWLGIDPSGNIWYLSSKAQSNGATTQVNYVTVNVGGATPVLTPLAYQVQYNRIGQTPQ